jgi:amidophosphoribosyltransferase
MARLKEYCGVVGVIGTPKAARLAHLALYALQHRGQEGSGIVAFGASGVHAFKSQGLVADVFNDAVLDGLPGDLAIGHNRYSTTGASSLENCQPLVASGRRGEVALAHNGNLVNAGVLRRELEEAGAVFQSTTDSEVILQLLARSREDSMEEALAEALRPLRGAYSLAIAARDELIGVRDPWGFRPLCYGSLPDGGWIVASESCALDITGATLEGEIGRGEAILFSRSGKVRRARLPIDEEERACIFELIYFSRPDSIVQGNSVDQVRRELGRRLAIEHPVKADAVMAVPDSSNSAALGFAEESGVPFELGLIRNHYIGRTFINPTQEMRDDRVRIKFNPVRALIEGKRLVVVDDSIVRGTTMRKLVKMLWRAGAKEIHLRLSSPPIISPCYYGIDTPVKSELIAASHTVEEIGADLRVTSIGYLSHEGMIAAAPRSIGYCSACFTGEYPVRFPGMEETRRGEAAAGASGAAERAPEGTPVPATTRSSGG